MAQFMKLLGANKVHELENIRTLPINSILIHSSVYTLSVSLPFSTQSGNIRNKWQFKRQLYLKFFHVFSVSKAISNPFIYRKCAPLFDGQLQALLPFPFVQEYQWMKCLCVCVCVRERKHGHGWHLHSECSFYQSISLCSCPFACHPNPSN